MDTYQPNQDVTLTFELVDDAGNALVPTALSYAVLDEREDVVVAAQALGLPAGGSPSVDVTVPAASNALAPSVPTAGDVPPINNQMGFRQVVLSITYAGGTLVREQGYVLRVRPQLAVLINSFQTFSAAQMRASVMLGLTNFPTAAPADQVNALMDAYARITRFGFFVRWPRNPDAQNVILWFESSTNVISPRLWPLMTKERFYTFYPENFRDALYKAQIIEADYRLGPDPIEERRAQGVLSEKIGESTTQYRPGRAVDNGLCRDTIQALTGFIDLRYTITRA